jgi:hypothetical protein
MEPATILYVQSDLRGAMALIIEACQKLGYFLWSLRGDPGSIRVMPNVVALRVSIFPNLVGAHRPPELESSIGSIHLVKISEERSRISLQREDLAGNPLAESKTKDFSIFCALLEDYLESQQILLSDQETGGKTRALRIMADTGPLPI